MKFKINKKLKILLFILVILGLIGYGSYKIYFEKLFLFQESEKLFLERVESYFDINRTHVPKAGDYKTITLQDMYDDALIETMYVPKSTKFCNEKNSFVRLVNEQGILRYVVYLDCGKFKSKVDHTAPVVVLNGEKKVIVNLYDSYQEEGVKSVVDDYDGLINNEKIEVLSNVNTNKPGNYKVTYKVYDKNYNMTKEVRDVVVADSLNNIVKRDTNNTNYYKGNVDNNYLLFSGMLFRIVKINEDNSVKIVSDDNISHLSYTEENYIDSNVRHWLNNYYLDHINENSKKYIVEGSWCVDNIENINNFTCNNKVKDMVGLLNVEEYIVSISNNVTYLDGTYRTTLLLNKKNKNAFYLSQFIMYDGMSYDTGMMYPSVRPSLNLKENTYVISGDGTIDKPYMLGDYNQGSENDLLKERLVGEYVKYSGYLTRISNITETGNIELIFMDELEIKKVNGAREKIKIILSDLDNYKFSVTQENNIGYLLNNEYINYLLSDYLVEEKFNIPMTVNNLKYDEYHLNSFTGKIFLPYSYQMFSSDYHHTDGGISGYLFSDYSSIDNKIFAVNPGNQICFDFFKDTFNDYSLKPVVFVTKKAKISGGNGTSNNPYILK